MSWVSERKGGAKSIVHVSTGSMSASIPALHQRWTKWTNKPKGTVLAAICTQQQSTAINNGMIIMHASFQPHGLDIHTIVARAAQPPPIWRKPCLCTCNHSRYKRSVRLSAGFFHPVFFAYLSRDSLKPMASMHTASLRQENH
eukprot:1280321-Amphidinium_carterae.1